MFAYFLLFFQIVLTIKNQQLMKKRIMLTLVCLLAAIGWVAAQNSPITGIVISAEDNEPIIGASVLVKGSTTGAVTDLDGKFTITDAPAGAKILQVSFVGMITQEVPITPGTIRVTLKNDAKLLDEVVVTALGIAKKEKSLTYSTQVVNGDELVKWYCSVSVGGRWRSEPMAAPPA